MNIESLPAFVYFLGAYAVISAITSVVVFQTQFDKNPHILVGVWWPILFVKELGKLFMRDVLGMGKNIQSLKK